MEHVKRETGHQNIYVLDRGLQSTRTMKAFSKDQITFICRTKENRKFIELESLITEGHDLDLGESTCSETVRFNFTQASLLIQTRKQAL